MGKAQKARRQSSGKKASFPERRVPDLTLEDYQTLAENSPDLIDRFDRGFHHLYVNAAAARLHGVPVRRLIGKTIRETGVPEPFCSQWEERISRVFKTGHPLDVRDTFPGCESIGYYESRCVPEFAPDGTVGTVLVVTRDVTAQARLDESQRESETLIRKIIELSPMSMAIVAMDGTIEYINRKAIETFGYSPAEIPTMEAWWLRAYPDESYRREVVGRWMGKVHQALADGLEIKGDEYLVTCKDGTVKTMFIFGVPIGDKVFVMFNDVSDFIALQDELKKSRDELEEKVRDRTAKLQGLAEEVIRVEHRERLRIAHVLHEDLQQWLAAAKFRVAELHDHVMQTPAQETAGRVRHMLDKAIEVTRSLAVDLRPPVIHEQGLKLAMRWLSQDMWRKFDLSVTVRVEWDCERVEEEMGIFVFDAVRELLMNVAKHAGVKAAIVRLKPKGKSQFTVEVADKGIGFDPVGNGSGHFGLFSIRERADVLGGRLDITSKPGRGTSVVITLPFRRSRRTEGCRGLGCREKGRRAKGRRQ